MKTLSRLVVVFLACTGLVSTVVGGPAPFSSKEIAPVPPPPTCCDWTGFYLGVHAGGQFGHSENVDIDDYDFMDKHWGYSESGFVGGGQVGYNFQWHWLVLGPEFDIGYMDLSGSGIEDHRYNDLRAHTDSDFYTTFRGRIGFAHDCWLFYATGGGIGVNYETGVVGTDPVLATQRQDFDWGYTVGGGIERKLGCHWSIKVEYLYFDLDRQGFEGTSLPVTTSPVVAPGGKTSTYRFDGETAGHIVRAGLNFHF